MNKREFLKCFALAGAGIAFCPFRISAFENGGDMTEASFYTSTAKGIKCQLCPNECDLKAGETGDCRVRTSKGNKLYTKAYNNPCAIHADPVEKKPLYHFLPETDAYSIAIAGCNLACLNCQNWNISQTSPDKTNNYKLSPSELVAGAIENKCKSIAYTYSEPTVFFEYMRDSAKIARQKGIKTIYVSNGYINEKPLVELCKYIDAANIDLKSFSDDIYLKLNGGKLEPILKTLKKLKELKVWLEITNLVVPSWTDDMKMIKNMCNWLKTNGFEDTPLHFSRFFPQYKLTQLPPTPVVTLENARNIALDAGLRYVYIGNAPGTKASDTICPKCKSTVVERKGYVITSKLIKGGKCTTCGQVIAGVWE